MSVDFDKRTADLLPSFVLETGLGYYDLSNNELTESSRLIRKIVFARRPATVTTRTIEQGCVKLYSEDMQHEQVTEGSLRIVNPFEELKHLSDSL